MKEHEFISPPAETGGGNQKKEDHLWFKQKNEHHTMPEEDRKGEIMKKFKKIFAALAASALVASMSFTSMAASITINSTAAEGTIDKTKYTYYKILNADILYDADDNIQSVSYYVETEAFAKLILATNLFKVTKSADGSRWIVEAKDANTITSDEIITAFNTESILESALATGTFEQETKTVGETSTVQAVADELSDGYYLIKSSLGTVLAVQTTGEKGVTINEKNTYPTLVKSEDKTTASYGEKITYTVDVTIPEHAAEVDIKVVDKMSEGLTPFDGEDDDKLIDVTAKVGETELTGNKAVRVSQAGNVIDIIIPAAAVAEYKNQTVQLTYQAVLNNKAVTNEAETNTAHLEYAHYTSIESQPVEVKAYDFILTKVDGDNHFIPVTAGDAEFTLWDARGNQIPVSLKDSATNTYRVLTGTETPTKIYAGGTENRHSATIEGLAAGTYYLQEEKAPTGYNKLTERKEIKVEANKEAGANRTDVQNNAGIQLPSTGGMGTVAFAVVGLIVMAGAAVTLIIKKRA